MSSCENVQGLERQRSLVKISIFPDQNCKVHPLKPLIYMSLTRKTTADFGEYGQECQRCTRLQNQHWTVVRDCRQDPGSLYTRCVLIVFAWSESRQGEILEIHQCSSSLSWIAECRLGRQCKVLTWQHLQALDTSSRDSRGLDVGQSIEPMITKSARVAV